MAITLQNNAADFSPCGNPMVFTFTSTNTAQANFSFYIELYINGALHSSHQVFKEYGTAARFDASPFIRAVLQSDLITDGTLINPYSDGTCTYYLDVYEKYGATPTVQIGSLQTTATLNSFNGALRHDAWIGFDQADYNMSTGSDILFLTSFPRSRNYFTGLNESFFIGMFRTSVAVTHYINFKLYDVTGSLIASDYLTLGSDKFIVFNCGPAEIIANTTITSGNFASCYRYAIEIRYGGAPGGSTLRSEIFNVYIDSECTRYTTRRLTWLNKFGVWDSFTFRLVSTESTNVETSTYSGEKGQWENTADYNYNLYKGERRAYAKQAKDTMILNSDWIKEDVQQWLVRELYESPKVYLEQTDGFEQVVVKSASYTLKQRKKDGLIQEQVQLDRTYSYTSQLN